MLWKNLTPPAEQAPMLTVDITPQPEKIAEDFIGKMTIERNFHSAEMERLSGIISDAEARLSYHTMAHEALVTLLSSVEPVSNITAEDFMPDCEEAKTK